MACLAVPNYAVDDKQSRDDVRRKLEGHFREVSLKLPYFKRIKVLHVWDGELPKTATRKVKRKPVLRELKRLESIARAGPMRAESGKGDPRAWLYDLVAQVANVKLDKVTPQARLAGDLGFDSLMVTELGVALEAAGVHLGAVEDVMGAATIEDLARLVEKGVGARVEGRGAKIAKQTSADDDDWGRVPEPVAELGRKLLRRGQRALYENLLDVRVFGQGYIPRAGNFVVTANHGSHLDMGLVKHALGEFGENVASLAARDYFFDSRTKRAYFENFTNLIPMERHGNLKESLRLAGEVLRRGYILLIFPEGTRSTTGEMADFKASLGYLVLTNEIDVLPMYLAGTFEALPKGAFIPRKRDVQVHIGPLVPFAYLRQRTQGLLRSEAYREASRIVEQATRDLRDGRSFVPEVESASEKPLVEGGAPAPSDPKDARAQGGAGAPPSTGTGPGEST